MSMEMSVYVISKLCFCRGRFSKDPVTYRPEKQFLKLFACCEKLLFKHLPDIREGKITAKFQSLNRALVEDTKGFISPEKFRDVRETGCCDKLPGLSRNGP